MTDFYLDSGGGAASSPFASWTDAAATLADIIAVPIVAGDTVYIEIGHNETGTASVTWNLAGTTVSSTRLISVEATDTGTGKTYVKATTAQLQRTSNGDISFSGDIICDGIYVSAGDDIIMTNSDTRYAVINSTLHMAGNGSTLTIGSNNGGCSVLLYDTEVSFISGGDGISVSNAVFFVWLNGPNNNSKFTQSGTISSRAMGVGARETVIEIDGVDLSVITDTIITAGTLGQWTRATFRNCVLNSSVSLINSIGDSGSRVSFIECDDTLGNDLYRAEFYDYYGSTIVTDTDYLNASDGTQSIAWKMVSLTTGQEFYEGTVSPWISGWIDSTGSKTFTIELVTDNVVLQNDEISLELEYLDSASDTQTTTVQNKIADILATPSNIASSDQPWTSPNITTDLDQKLTVTVTVNRVGPFRARVILFGTSKTVWVDPLVVIT